MDDFERRLKLSKHKSLKRTLYMTQMNPKKFLHNTTFSVQLPYIAAVTYQSWKLKRKNIKKLNCSDFPFP